MIDGCAYGQTPPEQSGGVSFVVGLWSDMRALLALALRDQADFYRHALDRNLR